MRLGNGLDDGEAEAIAPAGAGRAGEALERVRQVARREAVAVIAHLHPDYVAGMPGGKLDLPCSVDERVVDQIVEGMFQPQGIGEDQARLGPYGDRPAPV